MSVGFFDCAGKLHCFFFVQWNSFEIGFPIILVSGLSIPFSCSYLWIITVNITSLIILKALEKLLLDNSQVVIYIILFVLLSTVCSSPCRFLIPFPEINSFKNVLKDKSEVRFYVVRWATSLFDLQRCPSRFFMCGCCCFSFDLLCFFVSKVFFSWSFNFLIGL